MNKEQIRQELNRERQEAYDDAFKNQVKAALMQVEVAQERLKYAKKELEALRYNAPKPIEDVE